MIHISWQAIFTYVGPILGFLGRMAIEYWYRARKLKLFKQKDPVTETVKENVLIEYKLEEILKEFDADRVYLLQFHNGGNSYPFGKSILKFSVFYEKYHPGVALVRDKFQNIPASLFTKFFNYLSENNISYYTDLKKDAVEELEARGYNRETDGLSTYSASIKTLNDKFVGVLVIQYTKKKCVLPEDKIKDIQIYAASIGSTLEQDGNKK